MFATHATEIGTLHLHSTAPDSPALRLGLSNLLQSSELAPPGLPPGALLMVRRLTADEPLTLVRGSRVQAPDGWVPALRTHLTAAMHQAVRPYRGRLSPAAAAVLFADAAEIWACLALDLHRNRTHECWWWRTLLSRLVEPTIPALFLSQPRLLPAIVVYLDDWGAAATVAAAVPPAVARRIVAQSLTEHGLTWSPFVAAGESRASQRAPGDAAMARSSGDSPHANATPVPADFGAAAPTLPERASSGEPHAEARPAFTAPAEALLAAVAMPTARGQAALVPEQQALLAVALLLHRQPAAVRGQAFARAFQHWWRTQVQQPVRDSSPAAQDAAATLGQPARIDAPELVFPPPQAAEPAQTRAPTARGGRRTASAGRTGSVEAESGDAKPEAWSSPDSLPEPVTTNWGGVLYLLNLCEELALPAIFQRDWQLPEHLSRWDLLDVIGRALLDPLDHDWQDDPLWAQLARLAGRSGDERPGGGLPAADFRLPPAWLQTVGTVDWVEEQGRLRLWTQDPFVLVDCARHGSALRQAKRESSRYGTGRVPLEASAPQGLLTWRAAWFSYSGLGMQRWVGCTMPYVRVWLQRALALPTAEPATLAEALLRQRARLYVTRTHVDLVMPLEEIALPVRLAGLDRSPGWLADAGRVVTFHFE